MKQSRIRLLVMGGLGNQLFQYATAMNIANLTKSQLILDYRFLRLFGVEHQATLTDLAFRDPPQMRRGSNEFIQLKKVFISFLGLARRVSFFSNLLSRYLGIFVSKEIDERIELSGKSKPRVILGYFQTRKYIDVVKKSIDLPITPRIVSSMFEENLRNILENKVVSIHVRLGDYKNETKTIGNLSESYYLKAQDLFESTYPGSKYLIFTNDPNSLMRDYPVLLSREFNTLFHPEVRMTDIEEFSLMSACDGHIIANSTFSYWAAALSNNPRMVIRPSKWFRSFSEPQDLFPDEWITTTSQWI
jgi:hypothetical protein